jgi:uncharacterized damage-inducible protein DinB
MHPSVIGLAAILRLNTELLLNCLVAVDTERAEQRITPQCNSIAFLATHLVESRHFIAGILGAPLPSPFPPALAKARSLDEAGPLPSPASLAAAWERVSAHLAVVVERLDTADLARSAPALPGSDGTVLGALAFLVQHDSSHVGQVALLRRQVGLPAMSYTLGPREPGRAGA